VNREFADLGVSAEQAARAFRAFAAAVVVSESGTILTWNPAHWFFRRPSHWDLATNLTVFSVKPAIGRLGPAAAESSK